MLTTASGFYVCYERHFCWLCSFYNQHLLKIVQTNKKQTGNWILSYKQTNLSSDAHCIPNSDSSEFFLNSTEPAEISFREWENLDLEFASWTFYSDCVKDFIFHCD
uniref:Uncharacterized protein n=1 Tax=Dromaius novaehollandiae TaxID=8790 RepID=A0A8C4KGM8_DRONO